MWLASRPAYLIAPSREEHARRRLTLLLPLIAAATAPPPPSPDARFEALAADEYAWRLHSFAEPEGEGQARMLSPHLPDVSPAVQAARTARWQGTLAALDATPRDQLSEQGRTDYAVYRGQIEALLAQQRFRLWERPVNSDSSFWGDLQGVEDKPLRSVEEYRHALSQLAELPRYFDQQIANMDAGAARGFTPPKATIVGRDGSIASIANAKAAGTLDHNSVHLEDRTVTELQTEAAEIGIEGRSGMKKDELVKAIRGHQ